MKKLMIILGAALLFSACQSERVHNSVNSEQNFTSSYDASTKALKFTGIDKPFVLFFFTKDCGACAEQIPALNEIEKSGEAKIIGIFNSRKGKDGDIAMLKSKGVEFDTINDPKSVKYFSNIVGGVSGTPVSVIYGSDGAQKKLFLGLYPKSAFKQQIKLSKS